MHVVNLFDYITPSPSELLRWATETGQLDRDQGLGLYGNIIRDQSRNAVITICGWGHFGAMFPERVRQVHGLLTHPHALRITKDGHPGHPLYLSKELRPIPYPAP